MNIPQHVAFILDGNGRWAKSKGMPRTYGHIEGAKTVEKVCEAAWDMGIQYVTMYAFSTENWKRPKEEVEALMKLLRNYMKTCIKTAAKNNMIVRVIGDKTGLDDDIREKIEELEMPISAKHMILHYIREGHSTDTVYCGITREQGTSFVPLQEFPG